jgi:hypothetical protein
MKHYVYTLFDNTLLQVVNHYVAKYGSEATIRERLSAPLPGTDKNLFGRDLKDVRYGDAKIDRDLSYLKAGEELHEDVIIHGRWCNSKEKRLQKVKPWDVLVVVGHGRRVAGKPVIITDSCSSDDGEQVRSVSDVVGWLGPGMDGLSTQHVVIKLAMCRSAGPHNAPTYLIIASDSDPAEPARRPAFGQAASLTTHSPSETFMCSRASLRAGKTASCS